MKKKFAALLICLTLIPAPSKSMNNDAVKSLAVIVGGFVVYKTVGQKLIKYCGGSQWYLCAMGGAALVFAGALLLKGKEVESVVDSTCERDTDCKAKKDALIQQELPQILPPDVLAQSGDMLNSGDISGRMQRDLNSLQGDYKKAGVTIDPKTGMITMKDGKQISAGALGNPGAMAAAGMSSDQIAQLQSVQNDLNQKLSKIATNAKGATLSEDEGTGRAAGGGGGGSSRDGDGGYSGRTPGGRGVAASEGVAGLSRQTSTGEQIGVSGDNIFHMVNRRYAQGLSAGKYDPNLPPPR